MATVILTVGIIAVHQAFSRCIAAVRHSEEKLYCAFLLEKKATELLISSPKKALEEANAFNEPVASAEGYSLKNTVKTVVRGEENFILHSLKAEGPSGAKLEAPLLTPVPKES